VFTPLTNIPTVKTNIDTLLAWRGQKSVKIYLVVGGWVQSDYFDEATADTDSRANLVANIKSFCTDHGIDGVDLDWEPYNGSIDDTNYGLLISELRTSFNGTTLEISSAINPAHTSLADEYADADFIQLM
jgi:GH18 family chitinase